MDTNERRDVMHTWTVQSEWNAPTVTGGEGAVFWDENHKEYIDMSSMAECCNLGHQHPKVIAEIKWQADEMCFVTSGWGSEPRAKLAREILNVSGFHGGRVFFTLGGADANENAVKLARWATKKPIGKIITRHRSYHGATLTAMELSGDSRGADYAPGTPNVIHALPPYCYRCPLGLELDSCKIRCAEHIADLIEYEGPETVSAVLMEPAAGTNGIVAPDEYWPKLREICTRYGILLVADEVMSGFGRVGQWFAWQKHGEAGMPDMMTIAKGLTGAHLPLGAVVISKKVADYFENKFLPSGLTYSGHPLSCAAGLGAIRAYREEKLIERSRELGGVLIKSLQLIEQKHISVGEVRGEGLFAIIELVKNRVTGEPLAHWPKTASSLTKLVAEGRKRGVSFAVRGNLIVLAPPLVITIEQLRQALAVLDELLALCDAETA